MQFKHRTRSFITLILALTASGSILTGCNKDDKTADNATTANNGAQSANNPPQTTPNNPPVKDTTKNTPPGGTIMNQPSTNAKGGAIGDAALTAKVKTALISNRNVSAKNINVDVKSNKIILRGTQKTKEAVNEAIRTAKDIGQKSRSEVISQLIVDPKK